MFCVGQVARLNREILVDDVVGQGRSFACMRVNGHMTEQDLWIQELERTETGLVVYRQLYRALLHDYHNTMTSPSHIATLGVLRRRSQIALSYDPVTISVIEESGGKYQYEPVADVTTFGLLMTLLQGSEVSVVYAS